MVEVPGVEPGS